MTTVILSWCKSWDTLSSYSKNARQNVSVQTWFNPCIFSPTRDWQKALVWLATETQPTQSNAAVALMGHIKRHPPCSAAMKGQPLITYKRKPVPQALPTTTTWYSLLLRSPGPTNQDEPQAQKWVQTEVRLSHCAQTQSDLTSTISLVGWQSMSLSHSEEIVR